MARMVFGSGAAKGPDGQEKGHKWPETLSSVKVLKVNVASVKLTPVLPPPLRVRRGSYVRGVLAAPLRFYLSERR